MKRFNVCDYCYKRKKDCWENPDYGFVCGECYQEAIELGVI